MLGAPMMTITSLVNSHLSPRTCTSRRKIPRHKVLFIVAAPYTCAQFRQPGWTGPVGQLFMHSAFQAPGRYALQYCTERRDVPLATKSTPPSAGARVMYLSGLRRLCLAQGLGLSRAPGRR